MRDRSHLHYRIQIAGKRVRPACNGARVFATIKSARAQGCRITTRRDHVTCRQCMRVARIGKWAYPHAYPLAFSG